MQPVWRARSKHIGVRPSCALIHYWNGERFTDGAYKPPPRCPLKQVQKFSYNGRAACKHLIIAPQTPQLSHVLQGLLEAGALMLLQMLSCGKKDLGSDPQPSDKWVSSWTPKTCLNSFCRKNKLLGGVAMRRSIGVGGHSSLSSAFIF